MRSTVTGTLVEHARNVGSNYVCGFGGVSGAVVVVVVGAGWVRGVVAVVETGGGTVGRGRVVVVFGPGFLVVDVELVGAVLALVDAIVVDRAVTGDRSLVGGSRFVSGRSASSREVSTRITATSATTPQIVPTITRRSFDTDSTLPELRVGTRYHRVPNAG
jgi:hypothetical protein